MGFLQDHWEEITLPPISKDLLEKIRNEMSESVETPPGVPERYEFVTTGASEIGIGFDLGHGASIDLLFGVFGFYGTRYGPNRDEIGLVDTRFLDWAEKVKDLVEKLSKDTDYPIKILRIVDISRRGKRVVLKEFE